MPRPDPTNADFQERFAVLLDIGRVLTSTLEPEALYRTIYEQASRVLETTGFFVSLYQADTDRATVVFYADRGEIQHSAVTYRGSESRAIREARPIMEELSHPERAIMLLGPESDEEVTRSVIAVPLMQEGEVLGVLSAQSYRAGAYTPADLELLEAIAGMAAVAVANARSVEEMERQRRESERLEEVSRALASSLELDQVLQRIAEATLDLAEADGAGVWLLRPGGIAEIAVTAGELALPQGMTVEVPEVLRHRLLMEAAPLIVNRRTGPEGVPSEILDALEAESAIGVPLVSEGELIGALSVSHVRGREYSAREVRLLERFAHHAAVAVSNARLHDRVRTLSLTDPLTGLPNRRHMNIFLEKEFAAAERGRSLAVVLFDLDDFKRYNDTHGHPAGDAVLRRFAEILVEETRAMNMAARYGGDEFICILSDTDSEGGAIHAGRVMKAVRKDDLMSKMGVSAGMALYHPGVKSPEELIQMADRELYRAKAERRNRSISTS
ncbi:MAG: diguanylate cyclase [Gemmatimonadetes bacterium]|nr:diguanylate cyclase [Gemmatimonadota bacterium]NIQ60217.1 diguanylate cyclase [Gemmatimonadota bacterium]NIU80432.1 diguanylate cyclase [Gammaproteobacteria bacterium]NIX48769.1 diguanylate cyclase [Gemmatimonadota bacterium]NIY13225.1 diguanylate cyclase [Gemmatimonadota bacterium]